MLYSTFAIVLTFLSESTNAYVVDPSNNKTAYIDLLCKEGYLQTKEIIDVIHKVDRQNYFPKPIIPDVYTPVDLGYNATFSPIQMQCFALEHLKDHLKEGSRVLDVGSGTGYLTVCMAHLVGKTGLVVGIEHISELVYDATTYVNRDYPSLLQDGRIKYIIGDGRQGCPELGPYDAINIGAVADDVPDMLLEQLKYGGRIVVPKQNSMTNRTILQKLMVFDKHDNGTVTKTVLKELFIHCPCEPLGDKDSQYLSAQPTHQTY